jgi:hypothetical protein
MTVSLTCLRGWMDDGSPESLGCEPAIRLKSNNRGVFSLVRWAHAFMQSWATFGSMMWFVGRIWPAAWLASAHQIRSWQFGCTDINGEERRPAQMHRPRAEQAIGEVCPRRLAPEVQRLLDRRLVFELDVSALEQLRKSACDALHVELVAAAKHPLGLRQRAEHDEDGLLGLRGSIDQTAGCGDPWHVPPPERAGNHLMALAQRRIHSYEHSYVCIWPSGEAWVDSSLKCNTLPNR